MVTSGPVTEQAAGNAGIDPSARGGPQVNMGDFDDKIESEGGSPTSSLERGKGSPSKPSGGGPKVSIKWHRFLIFLACRRTRAAALFYGGCSKPRAERPVGVRSYRFFSACMGGGGRSVGWWCAYFAVTKAISRGTSRPFSRRSGACCERTLPIQNAAQPSSAFCCASGGWWSGCWGGAGGAGAHQRGAHMPNWVRMAVHAVVPGCASYNYTSNKSTSVVFFRVFSAAQPRSVVVRAGHGRWAHGGTSKPQPCGHNGKNRGLGPGAPMPQAWPL